MLSKHFSCLRPVDGSGGGGGDDGGDGGRWAVGGGGDGGGDNTDGRVYHPTFTPISAPNPYFSSPPMT